MILARTLRRTFVLHGPLPDEYLAFLHTTPSVLHQAVQTSEIDIARRSDGLFSMTCGWGRQITGSARALATSLDKDMFRLSSQDEGAAPQVPGGILRVHGVRSLLVGGSSVDLDGLIVALLLQGAAFEGRGLAFFGAEGVCAHLMKPRLQARHLAAFGPPISAMKPSMLVFHHDQPRWAIDPTFAGTEWRVSQGPVRVVVFLEQNVGGRAAIAPLRSGDARSRLMRDVIHPRKPTLQDFVRLTGVLCDAMVLRLVIGDVSAAAALLAATIARDRN